MHAAAYFGHVEVVKMLVEAKIDVGIRNTWKCTALDEAKSLIQEGQQWKDIVYYLENHSK
uniref:Uncharacterized protein n=1 Tax=Arcella intermedia TaxID=1963864 RepID=A0A6B2LWN8_9EUKA